MLNQYVFGGDEFDKGVAEFTDGLTLGFHHHLDQGIPSVSALRFWVSRYLYTSKGRESWLPAEMHLV